MQSIFRLPWCTDHFGPEDKIMYGAPTMDLTAKKLKRKHASTPDPESLHIEVKRARPATAIDISTVPVRTPAAMPPQTDAVNVVSNVQKDTTTTSPLDATMDRSTRLRLAIENQLNLQILMKHNELRLIDQELAKCQIALEQLRRCELKQYPSDLESIRSGTGATVALPGYTRPSHAPPLGVVDGPYTRHYKRWLLPDAQFDAIPMTSPVDDQRATRHGARKPMTPQRHPLDTFQAPVAKKDCSAPLVLRRSTDNKLVKLVCNNCNRGNMSSIQGFLNHCRIAHKVIYESHDAAAIDCGRILDDQELANLPSETQTMPVSKPPVRHTPSRTASVAVSLPTPQSVHPLNKSEAAIPTSKPVPPAVAIKPVTNHQSEQFASTPFNAAAGLPKLSALMARRNHGGNLQQAAIDARRKPEFSIDDISPATLTPNTPVFSPVGRGIPGRQHAGKTHGVSRPQQPSYFPQDTIHSPNTMDGNPGLVSDVEDDVSISEEESHAPPESMVTPFGIRRECGDSMDLDGTVEGLTQHGVVIRRNSMLNADGQSSNFAGN